MINELAHAIAPSQILLRSRRVRGANLCQLHLLVRTQLQAQPFDYVVLDCVLHANDVAGVGIDAIAPENLARSDVKQLRRHAYAFAGAQEAGGKD